MSSLFGLFNRIGMTLALIAGVIFVFSNVVQAQDNYWDRRDRGGFDAIQQDNRTAQMEIRIQQLESEIRRLTGRVEQQAFEIRELKSELDKVQTDTQLRFSDLENNASRQPAPPRPSAPQGIVANPSAQQGGQGQPDAFVFSNQQDDTTTEFPVQKLGSINSQGADAASDGAAASYENAFAMLKNGNYDEAEQAFQAFLNSHGNHVLAPNAQYWLGETFYVRGNFERAARIFAEGYQSYPKGPKAPDNLLKLGLSLASLDNKEDACVALRQLEMDYDGSSGPVLRRARQEMSRLGCQA